VGGVVAAAARALLLLVLALGLGACASVPLSTLWKLRDFGSAELAGLDPQQVRVAGRLEPAPLSIDPQSVRLTLTLTPSRSGQPVRHGFGLRPSRVSDARLAQPGGRAWQVFELDEAGLASMRRLQPRFARLEKEYSRFEFSVDWRTTGPAPATLDALILSMRLQLAADQAPVTLFDRAKIPLKHASGGGP
jgi:hypothetical protein